MCCRFSRSQTSLPIRSSIHHGHARCNHTCGTWEPRVIPVACASMLRFKSCNQHQCLVCVKQSFVRPSNLGECFTPPQRHHYTPRPHSWHANARLLTPASNCTHSSWRIWCISLMFDSVSVGVVALVCLLCAVPLPTHHRHRIDPSIGLRGSSGSCMHPWW